MVQGTGVRVTIQPKQLRNWKKSETIVLDIQQAGRTGQWSLREGKQGGECQDDSARCREFPGSIREGRNQIESSHFKTQSPKFWKAQAAKMSGQSTGKKKPYRRESQKAAEGSLSIFSWVLMSICVENLLMQGENHQKGALSEGPLGLEYFMFLPARVKNQSYTKGYPGPAQQKLKASQKDQFVSK